MVLNFANLITPDEQRVLLDLMARAVAGQSGVLAETGRVVTSALVRQTDFVDAVHPRALAGLRLSRLRPGMPAGVLVDEPLMGDSSLMRNDVAFTLFLNEPDGYEGGELQLDGDGSETLWKLPARSLLCCPGGTTQRLRPVLQGERLVVVGWLQSLVRDAQVRGLLHDLGQARSLVHAAEGNSRAFELLNKSYANLLRRYAET